MGNANMEWYPLTFDPIYKEKIWGGNKIRNLLKRNTQIENIGESFELSGLDKEISRINNGYLRGQLLKDVIKEFPQELLGNKVCEKYDKSFPLLFKFIDAKLDLSIQVHPDKGEHSKTEFWYIIESDNGKLNIGFKEAIDNNKVSELIKKGQLENALSYYEVKKDDAFLIKAGTVHAICSNVMLAEIQQASDTTYRLYDYNRRDKNDKLRELHIDKGLECINTSYTGETAKVNHVVVTDNEDYKIFLLTQNKYFTVEKISITGMFLTSSKDDSFNVIMVIDGHGMMFHRLGEISLFKGDTFLIPSAMGEYTIEGNIDILNTYI